jgi:hypothetical protein
MMRWLWRSGISIGGAVTFFFIRRYTRLRKANGALESVILDEINDAYGSYRTLRGER